MSIGGCRRKLPVVAACRERLLFSFGVESPRRLQLCAALRYGPRYRKYVHLAARKVKMFYGRKLPARRDVEKNPGEKSSGNFFL